MRFLLLLLLLVFLVGCRTYRSDILLIEPAVCVEYDIIPPMEFTDDNALPAANGYLTYESAIDMLSTHGFFPTQNMTITGWSIKSRLGVICTVSKPQIELLDKSFAISNLSLSGGAVFNTTTFPERNLTAWPSSSNVLNARQKNTFTCAPTADDVIVYVHARTRCYP